MLSLINNATPIDLIMKENTPLVSVITPFYNNKMWLEEALESVFNQSYQNLEVIIINDGSKDNIDEVMLKYPNFHFYKTTNNGAGAARNMGIEKALGDYICFLDSDDLWEKEKIEKQIKFMKLHGFVWSHTNYLSFENDSPEKMKILNPDIQGYILPKMLISCGIATPCVMIKADVLKSDNTLRFNQDYKVGEDSAFWIKLAQKYELGYLPDVLTKVRLRGKNAAYDPRLQLQAKAQFYNLVKKNKNFFKNNKDYKAILLGFYMANKLNKTLSYFPENKTPKYIAYLFYAFPYLYLKIALKFLKL